MKEVTGSVARQASLSNDDGGHAPIQPCRSFEVALSAQHALRPQPHLIEAYHDTSQDCRFPSHRWRDIESTDVIGYVTVDHQWEEGHSKGYSVEGGKKDAELVGGKRDNYMITQNL